MCGATAVALYWWRYLPDQTPGLWRKLLLAMMAGDLAGDAIRVCGGYGFVNNWTGQ
jgi:hypothetical protein